MVWPFENTKMMLIGSVDDEGRWSRQPKEDLIKCRVFA